MKSFVCCGLTLFVVALGAMWLTDRLCDLSDAQLELVTEWQVSNVERLKALEATAEVRRETSRDLIELWQRARELESQVADLQRRVGDCPEDIPPLPPGGPQ